MQSKDDVIRDLLKTIREAAKRLRGDLHDPDDVAEFLDFAAESYARGVGWGEIFKAGAAFAHRNSGVFDSEPDHQPGCGCAYCSEAYGVPCDDFGAPFTVAPDYD